jgi:hypothetical protein
VHVLEPSETETLQILQGLAERYERHHHCCYDEEALEAAVKLSHTYIADRFLPDKVRESGQEGRRGVDVGVGEGAGGGSQAEPHLHRRQVVA